MEDEEQPPCHVEPRPPRHDDHHDTPATAAFAHADAVTQTQHGPLDASSGSEQHPNGLPHLSRHLTDAPPFWSRHDRSVSTVSYHSINHERPTPILLEDRSEEEHEASIGCWAKSVAIDDFTVISGPTGIGAYVVWHCTIDTLKGGDLAIRKRYSEFDQLRSDLVRSFPHAEAMMPKLPRKSTVSRFRPKFLDQRKAGLEHFMNCILLNPEFAASPVLKDFIFSCASCAGCNAVIGRGGQYVHRAPETQRRGVYLVREALIARDRCSTRSYFHSRALQRDHP